MNETEKCLNFFVQLEVEQLNFIKRKCETFILKGTFTF